MCGIAGWYDQAAETGGDHVLLGRMLDRIDHRGPDDSGVCVDAPVRLGHTRLAIIDIDGGAQPMTDPTGRYTVVFNGEIYNFRELRRRLRTQGYVFRTRSDTEVLLAVYDSEGIEGLARLNGMFAFALWDSKRRRLFLVRDRLGIKPLYFTRAAGGAVVFGSEIKCLLTHPGVRPEVRHESILDYLAFRHVPGAPTFFKGITQVEPGCYLTCDEHGVRTHRYWSLPENPYESLTDELVIDRTAELVESAVRRRLVSDVPVGAFLSGGLDSSLITAFMARERDESVRTYSIGFEGEDYNELEYARRVSELYNTQHTPVFMGQDDYLAGLPDVISMRDEPLGVPNEIALYRLAGVLSKDVTVVLSGEGADELFAGYGRIFRSPWDYERANNAAFMHGPHAEAFSLAMRGRYGTAHPASEAEHFALRYAYTSCPDRAALVGPELTDNCASLDPVRGRVRELLGGGRPGLYSERCLRFFQKYHLENLLRRVDMTTMANSVEARVPFVDHELVEHVARIPLSRKMPWRSAADRVRARRCLSDEISERHDIPKAILKTIARPHLPRSIVDRKKMGFPVPLEMYGRNGLLRAARDVLLDRTCRSRGVFRPRGVAAMLDKLANGSSHSQAFTVWMLVNVEMWFRLYIDSPLTNKRERSDESHHTRRRHGRTAVPADAEYAQEPA